MWNTHFIAVNVFPGHCNSDLLCLCLIKCKMVFKQSKIVFAMRWKKFMKSINYAAHNGDNFPNGKNKYLTYRIINIYIARIPWHTSNLKLCVRAWVLERLILKIYYEKNNYANLKMSIVSVSKNIFTHIQSSSGEISPIEFSISNRAQRSHFNDTMPSRGRNRLYVFRKF